MNFRYYTDIMLFTNNTLCIFIFFITSGKFRILPLKNKSKLLYYCISINELAFFHKIIEF